MALLMAVVLSIHVLRYLASVQYINGAGYQPDQLRNLEHSQGRLTIQLVLSLTIGHSDVTMSTQQSCLQPEADPPPAYHDAMANSSSISPAPVYFQQCDAGQLYTQQTGAEQFDHPSNQTSDEKLPIRSALMPETSRDSASFAQRVDSRQSLSLPCVIPRKSPHFLQHCRRRGLMSLPRHERET